MMVPGVGIEKAEGFAPCCRIHNLIYAWQRKRILRARFVETGVVDTPSPFAALFLQQHRVGQPLGVVYLPDEARCKELLDLLPYEFAPITVKTSQLLFNRLGTQFDVDLMFSDFPWDARHVG
jgi:hypothetical protein